jgi:hypothetical protein
MRRLLPLILLAAFPFAMIAEEPAAPKPQFQAKCPCGWSAPKRDGLDKALADGEKHEKAHPGHNWQMVRTNKK